ncbi:MAG TPA: GNAT family N-acetyltransferase [Amaricoccus sp.]|nr:GNAT family N-acetyltransferase [Amaricoccus sp.]
MSETEFPRQSDIDTRRLRLRRLRPADAALVALYCGNEKLAHMTAVIPHPYPPGAAESFVERTLASPASGLTWALDTGADGENGMVGLISLKPGAPGEPELGYWVAPAFWGTGYATEAVAGVVDWARAQGLKALTAVVFQDNAASMRVITRTGFGYRGETEVHSLARGAMVPSFLYRLEL